MPDKNVVCGEATRRTGVDAIDELLRRLLG
jgi:hypothetical protein